MHRLLIKVASLVAEHRLWSTGSGVVALKAQLPCSIWDLPGPGIEPMSPASANSFLTIGPPGKPSLTILGASHSAWAGLRGLCVQGLMYLVVNDGEGPPSPSHLLSASEMLHSPLPCTGGKPSGDAPDVFISYRRNTGSQLAR